MRIKNVKIESLNLRSWGKEDEKLEFYCSGELENQARVAIWCPAVKEEREVVVLLFKKVADRIAHIGEYGE